MVSLYVDGSKRLFSTNAATVGQVLARSKVKLGSNDLVEPSATTKLNTGQFNINVYRAHPVVIIDGQRTYHILSAYQSPELLAQAAGLTTYPQDTYQTSVITNFVEAGSIGEQVIITPAKPMTILVDGTTRNIRTQASSVGSAISGADISLGAKDTVSIPQTTPVTPGMTITITRVTEANVTLTTVLPHATQSIPDNTMNVGESIVQAPGSDGQRTVTYLINYRDGVETSRQELQVVSQTAPVTEIVHVGTKIPDDAWAKLRNCESGGDYTRNSGNGYYGAYQFDLLTWQGNGGTGYPDQASPAVQDAIAKAVYARRGSSPWPVCGHFLSGL